MEWGNVQSSLFCVEANLFVAGSTDRPARRELNCAKAVIAVLRS